MSKELVEAARKVELETFKKHGVYEKAPIEECWKGRQISGGSQVSRHQQGRQGETGVRLQVSREGDQEGQAGRSVRGDTAARSEEDALPALGQRARHVLGLWRCGSRLLSRESKEKGA